MTARPHGLRIDAEPDVVKAHLLNQRDVAGGGVSEKVLFGVSLRIRYPCKPFTGVDSMAQAGEARGRNSRRPARRKRLCGGDRSKAHNKNAWRRRAQQMHGSVHDSHAKGRALTLFFVAE